MRNKNIISTSEFVNINTSEAKKLIDTSESNIIDVRTLPEVTAGIIPNAIHLDVTDHLFREKIRKLEKPDVYIIYCRSGRRSISACNIMEREGFNDLYNLEGGYNAWK